MSQHINDTVITVDYNRPVARGRELFGKLVPYGHIWCPGADDATTVEVSTAVTIEGKELAAGKYSLWSDPGAERWTVIFNKNASVWHTGTGGPGRDEWQGTLGPADIWKRWRSTSRGTAESELALRWGTVAVGAQDRVPQSVSPPLGSASHQGSGRPRHA